MTMLPEPENTSVPKDYNEAQSCLDLWKEPIDKDAPALSEYSVIGLPNCNTYFFQL